MIVRTSIGGEQVRVRLWNAFGASPVSIGAGHIALRGTDSSIAATTGRQLTFSGKPTTTLSAGQILVSDPVSLRVPPLTDVAVSLYIAGDAGVPTSHTFGLRPTYVSTTGNYASAASIDTLAVTTQSYYWLAGVDVLGRAEAGTLVTFGDSITDGDQSTPDTNRMWPALLAARLQANRATANVGVVNAGIAGNRLLGDNNSGVARFVHHALAVPGVKWITVLEGINDISAATRQFVGATGGAAPTAAATLSPDDLIAAYRQMIALAHQQGVKVIGCTITPYGGSSTYTPQGEAIREAVNAWIRTSGAFDAVIDFDAATRDTVDRHRFRSEADSPDLLHPGDGGYRLMADAIDLTMFAPTTRPRF
jgi:lysophospholipase L1-like esterase